MKRLQTLAIAGLMAVPAVVFGATLPDVVPPNQAALEARVLHELRMLPYYSVFDDLGFTVNGTQVTLTGEVTNPVLDTDARNAVKRIPGVTAVNDRIEVLPLSDFDRGIRMRTYFAIYGFGPLQKYSMGAWPSIHILVKNGDVRLVGVVNSTADSNMAYIRANGVPGAFHVTNQLRVEKTTS